MSGFLSVNEGPVVGLNYHPRMIWFYERGSDTLKIETRYNSNSRAYELVWYHPDGTLTVETFSSEALFRQRSEAVEAGLANDHWHLSGTPTLVPGGWRRD